jgi:hypothetical protein
MLLAGAPAITNTDVVPVSEIACVNAICIVFTWCLTEVVQFDVTIVISSSLLAQCVKAKHKCLGVGYDE